MNSIPRYSFSKVTMTAASLAFMFSPVERVCWRTGLPIEEIASSSV
jgi:hypothetical protein